MALSVALPSFDAFLRSARRAPAVLPGAAPMSFLSPNVRSAVDHNDDYASPTKASSFSSTASSLVITPPSSPYYGHFVSLSPGSSPVSDSTTTKHSWPLTSSGSDREGEARYNLAAMRSQDLSTQQCVAIAPKPRHAPSSSSSSASKILRTKKKYLKERQRCEIVRRVHAGEKQAHLAKEFGVSRAAVCYLLKHEADILRRSAARQQRRQQQHRP